MHARYHSPLYGRFLSVDPAGASFDPRTPQSWNRYAYVRNNPIKYVDPDGRVLDTVLDVGFIGSDLYDIGKSVRRGEGVSGRQLLALGGDVVGAVIPFFSGGGEIGTKIFFAVDKAGDAGGAAGRIASVADDLIGGNARNVRTVRTGRLSGFQRADTDLAGGAEAAGKLFEKLTGRGAKGGFDRVVLKDKGLEVVFRASGDKVKIDITRLDKKLVEKITFLP